MIKRSLYLNDNWDINLNDNGDLTTTSGLYCDAQNVANRVRLFTKDAYLAQDKGVPHFTLDLGKMPPLAAVRSAYRKAARDVENIADAVVNDLAFTSETRALTGTILATTETGEQASVEI